MVYKPKNRFNLKLKAIAALGVIIIILLIISNYSNFIESFYSEGLYLFICHILHPVFNIFPFSVGDVCYILLITYGLIALIKLIRLAFKKRLGDMLNLALKVVIIAQALFVAFYLFWGLNYFRPSAAQRLGLQDTSYTLNDIEVVTAMIIDSANASKAAVTAEDTLQSNQQIYNTAAQAISNMSVISKNFPAIHAKAKSSMLSFLINYMATSGYYNPFTSEAQVNYQMPYFLRPFVACHEMSHQMGFGAEDEADFSGFITGISSHDRLLRYSAYYAGTQEFMHAVLHRDTTAYKRLKVRISPQVLADFKTERLDWKKYEGRTGVLSSFFYDHFLKANNQPHGLQTYNRMIRLAMAWYRKKGTNKL